MVIPRSLQGRSCGTLLSQFCGKAENRKQGLKHLWCPGLYRYLMHEEVVGEKLSASKGVIPLRMRIVYTMCTTEVCFLFPFSPIVTPSLLSLLSFVFLLRLSFSGWVSANRWRCLRLTGMGWPILLLPSSLTIRSGKRSKGRAVWMR